MWRERGKREILGPPPFKPGPSSAPTLQAPTLRAPTFSGFGPNPSGLQCGGGGGGGGVKKVVPFRSPFQTPEPPSRVTLRPSPTWADLLFCSTQSCSSQAHLGQPLFRRVKASLLAVAQVGHSSLPLRPSTKPSLHEGSWTPPTKEPSTTTRGGNVVKIAPVQLAHD